MKITLQSTTPMLMHNIRLADDQDPYVIEIKKYTAKRVKTDDDKREIDRLSFAGALYHDERTGPYMPAEWLFRSLMNAGTITRDGKKIERGVVFQVPSAPLVYDGPRDVVSLWGNGTGSFVDRRMVNVRGSRVARVRPIFPVWSAEFDVLIDPAVINPMEFRDIVEKAGRMIGVGDYRRFYGKFKGEVIE